MKAVVCERFGEPAEVLQVRAVPEPEPGPGEVRVRMRYSPINPSDLLVVRGRYGRLPTLPATPGFEGVGVVEKVGPGWLAWLRGLRPGRRVVVLNSRGGNWQEQVVVPARQLLPLADDIPDEQGAVFFVNPATAVVMTRYVLALRPGDWLLQTAAASALGRMIIRLGKHQGFHTINVVRRREQVDELRRLGGDAVICLAEESLPERVRQLTGSGVRLALDAVGGSTGAAVVASLGPGGRLLVYGTLSGEPIPLDPRQLMVGSKRIEGFWLAEWLARQRLPTLLALFRTVQRLIRTGVLTSSIEAIFPLEQVQEAVRRAEAPGRQGKILLRCSGSS